MFTRVLLITVVALLASGLSTGCEKTNHENIDKWTRTEKGPGKLKKAVKDEGVDPDLAAHAAANMIRMGNDPDVRAAFEEMSQPRRVQVISKLAPRLWDLARIEREDSLPGSGQIVAKDALISLRKYADDAQKQQIDTYLIDWYAVMSYEGRAKVGSTLGSAVVRMVGAPAGKKLMSVVNSVLAAPGQEKTKIRIGDELMLGLAASGNADAVKYVLDIARMDRGDPTLSKRAMRQLYTAYVDPAGLFDLADPAALGPNLDALVAIAKDETMAGQPANDAISLIRAAGSPQCFEPLLSMVRLPHPDPRFRYATAYAALYCGGTKTIAEVVRALPDSGNYVREDLHGAVSGEIAKMGPRDQVQGQLRELLGDKGKVSKWVAIEALAAMKSVEDRPRIEALAGEKEKLVGYFGDQSGRDPKDRKTDPSLGQRAKELAVQLGSGSGPK
jgi:hypothetical protein